MNITARIYFLLLIFYMAGSFVGNFITPHLSFFLSFLAGISLVGFLYAASKYIENKVTERVIGKILKQIQEQEELKKDKGK